MSSREKLPIAALITAAGLSSRMGALKALLPFGEGSMISTVVQNMRAGGAEKIVVVTGYRAEEIEEHLDGWGCIFVRNRDYAKNEMFDSLCLGLKELDACWDKVLISPVDVPSVSSDTIKLLLETEGDFVAPTYKGRQGHPVVLRGELIPAILSHSGEGGLRGAVEALGIAVTRVDCADEGVSLDADTPVAYEKLLELRKKL